LAQPIPARLTAREGRRFAFPVGIAFGVLSGIALWRGHPITASTLVSLAGALLFAGLLIPARLGPVQRAWMALAKAISRVTTPVFLGVLYFLVLAPAGFIRRTVARNPLVHRDSGDSYWYGREGGGRSDLRRQF
jgi:hypothetical protein